MPNLNKQNCMCRYKKCTRPKLDYDVLMFRVLRVILTHVNCGNLCVCVCAFAIRLAPQLLIVFVSLYMETWRASCIIACIWQNIHHANVRKDVRPEPSIYSHMRKKSAKFVQRRSTKRQLMLWILLKIEETKKRVALTVTYGHSPQIYWHCEICIFRCRRLFRTVCQRQFTRIEDIFLVIVLLPGKLGFCEFEANCT